LDKHSFAGEARRFSPSELHHIQELKRKIIWSSQKKENFMLSQPTIPIKNR